mmetsp:Transcript_4072/g.4634  ORF Transcript_4072/g.4634 Transcript_4072/m.4634 type:complete len:220 (+) Transcript_4072:92-751(+)|eukprot:CAMPEP_0198254130 /NCGR_PEP_ID=MMETSP1447-20131203/4508_1 /TAXON_ID=420782 /ORGANISM="Chaetoceros dichaeta, Strain CCMP1751" /LENGTH=219 /DNA_ID=CAMNT_0043940093 /DNA_START=91 /DNA_END=750 /DNA_ORIENTATION=-
MKLIIASILTTSVASFSPANTAFHRPSVVLFMDGLDQSGNTWKPQSETMGSTDTGDYFPDDYDGPEVDFTAGMGPTGSGNADGPALPGMENFGEDAIMMGGIEVETEIPAGMEFIPSSVPDGEFAYQVAASSSGKTFEIEIKPFCMGFEDFYVAFSAGSHESLSVSPPAGRMDRRGGESSFINVTCEPNGKAGTFTGDLVLVLPEDDSKVSYKITATAF